MTPADASTRRDELMAEAVAKVARLEEIRVELLEVSRIAGRPLDAAPVTAWQLAKRIETGT